MIQTDTASRLEELSAELALHTGRLVRALSRRAGGDVPTAVLRLLGQIEELEPVGIGALATADRTSQPTMSTGVQRLCDKGWATKVPHPRDARSALVSLTDEGRAVLAEARRRRAAVIAERLQHTEHDERDLATAVAVLRGLLEQPETTHPVPHHHEGTA